MTIQGPDGKAITDHGKDLAVWEKQGDGSWKMVADTFNSDLPAAMGSK
jgi:ketosteroid isomerase-like protein